MASKVINDLENHFKTSGISTSDFKPLIKISSYQFFCFIFKDIKDELDHTANSRSLLNYIDFRLVLKLFLIFFNNVEAIILVKEVYKFFHLDKTILKNDDKMDNDDDSDDEEEDDENKERNFSDIFDKSTNLYETYSIEYKAIPSLINIIKLNKRFVDFFFKY